MNKEELREIIVTVIKEWEQTHCALCNCKIDEMKYKFHGYWLCHTCYGYIYDEIGEWIKKEREKVMKVIEEEMRDVPFINCKRCKKELKQALAKAWEGQDENRN